MRDGWKWTPQGSCNCRCVWFSLFAVCPTTNFGFNTIFFFSMGQENEPSYFSWEKSSSFDIRALEWKMTRLFSDAWMITIGRSVCFDISLVFFLQCGEIHNFFSKNSVPPRWARSLRVLYIFLFCYFTSLSASDLTEYETFFPIVIHFHSITIPSLVWGPPGMERCSTWKPNVWHFFFSG